tara:strand:- start:559 stop:732 length:174 start_codon:yes stop_codon:yes gene_type:complete
MKIQQPNQNTILDQLNKTTPVDQKTQSPKKDFAVLLDDQVTLQNGGGGHPDKKKTEN